MFWTLVAQRGSGSVLRLRSLVTASRCTLPHSRSFSSTVPATSTTQSEAKPRPVRRWSLSVSPFVNVRTHLDCSISIRPLDPHAFPEADRAFITVHGPDSEQEVGLDDLHVHYDEEVKELVISSEGMDSTALVEMDAPIKSNLFITARGKGNVQIRKMECDICKVETEKGNCLLHSIRGHDVEVQSHGGNVTGTNTIHGNVVIRTEGDGEVSIKKLQGTTMNVSTESGSLKVKAIYAESSCVSSCSGRVELGHAHGKTLVKNVSGDTVIDGSNSFLKVSSNTGGIDVYVGDGGSAELHSQEGAVTVRVPSTLRVGVELHGTSVDVQDEIVVHGLKNTTDGLTTLRGYMNEEPPADQWIKAQADKSSVTLKMQSWFESLKLGS
ncbi:Protein FAM185A [Oryzias melastigma]|uniref:Family with sequence similarity 185 member A n=1 Tax=Oryzias melastigma TaxID=30732 RepID=A0A3B3BT99_ORYME|nr:protein FAM185A [Oryzias melastigma]KAF6735646.1 Protein FAM185A [Oryzias melastigma]